MNGSTSLRIGVLGTGRIGRMHAEIVALKLPDTELTAVFDADADVAADVGARLGAPARTAVEEVIEADDIDAVAICTPTPLHAENVIAAADAGKAIFCEKPISLMLSEVDRALAAVEESGVPFQIGFNQRFDPGHATVAAAVSHGEIGDPQLARISSRDPQPPPVEYARTSGGIFLDMTIHDFDLARHIVGSEVVEVFATGSVMIEPRLAEFGDLDTVVVVLTHENGCVTTIDNSRQAAYGYDQRIEVFGPSGVAASDNLLANAAIVRDRQGARGATLIYPFLERYAASYLAEWNEFIDAVRSGRPPSVGIADARPPLLIGLAAWRSIQQSRPVRVEEIAEEDPGPVAP